MDPLRELVEKPKFEAFILATIGLNTILLSIARPNVKPSSTEVALDGFCTFVFLVEFVLKILGLGAREYFSDNWNRLDFVVVMESLVDFILNLIPGLDAASFSAKTLRLLRLLRTFRTLRFIPGMRTVIATLIGSATHTIAILTVMFMSLFLCSVFAYVYWADALHYRCMDIQTGVFNLPSTTGRFATLDSKICYGGHPGDDNDYGCSPGYACAKYDHNPQDDTITFDDIWNTFVSSFRVILRDHWMLTMWYTQEGTNKAMWLPFLLVFFVGAFALVNLFPGAMMTSFQAQVRSEVNERKRAEDRAAAGEDDDGGGGAAVRSDFELLLETFEEAYQEDLKHVNEVLAGKEVVPELEEEAKEPPYTPNCSPLCKDARNFVEQPFGPFAQFIYVIILLMIVVLALDSYNASAQEQKVYSALNITFNVIFLAEALIKIGTLGPVGYFSDSFNVLDFVLVVVGLLDLAVQAALSGTKALRVVRIFRLARVARMASLSKVVKLTNPTPSIDLLRIVEILSDSGWTIGCVFFLLLFFNFLFTLSGMQLFGGRQVFDGDRERFNYDSFNNAFMTTFSMTTGSTGFVIFKQIAFSMGSNLVFGFYIIWQVLSKYLMLSTVAATLFQQVEEDAITHMKKMARTTMRSCYLFERSMMNAWKAMVFRKWRDMMYRAGGRQVTGAYAQVKEDATGSLKGSKGMVKGLLESPKSYGIFSQRSGIRIVCAEISNHWAFELLGIIVVLLACVSMCFRAEEGSGARTLSAEQEAGLWALNAFALAFFLFEFVVKTIYMGVWVAKTSYLRSSMLNRLDTIATFSALIGVASGDANVSYLQLLRVTRCLTPWRIVTKVKPVARVLITVVEALASIGHVATVTVAFWCLFALIGMQLFGGYFSYCNDPTYPPGAHRNHAVNTTYHSFPDGCNGHYEDTLTGELVKRKWVTPFLNFDDFFSAIYCTLTIFSLDGWERIYFSAIDGVDPDRNPERNANKGYAVYFLFVIFVFFVMLQMIVGAMYGAYMYVNCTADGTRISSLKVGFWQIYSTKLRYIVPFTDPARPRGGWRLMYYRLVKTRNYAVGVMFTTLASLSCRYFVWGATSTFYRAPNWIRIVDFVFAVLFFLEWLARASAFSFRGVNLNWYDKADTLVTMLVLAYAFLDIVDMQDGSEVWDTLGFNFYSFMCACVGVRLFRVIALMPETHTCIHVMKKSMRTLIAMAVLSTIITFAYAIVGVSLFGKYSDKFEVDTDASILTNTIYNSEHSNFKRVLPAMQLLYYIGTGADFAGVMQQGTLQTPPSLAWFMPIYLLSYLILIKYVIFSVCMLIVVFKFTLHATDVNGLAMDAIDNFRDKWQERDPFATGEIACKDFPDFVRSLRKPLGVDASASHLEVDRYIKKCLLVMGFAAADIVGAVEDLPYTVKFGRTLIAMHYIVIFGDAFGDDAVFFRRRVVARNRIRQFKYGVAAQIVKLRDGGSSGGAASEASTGVKDLSILRLLLPRVFEQRLLKSFMHEIYRLKVQVQFKGYTQLADRETDLILKVLREEYEAAALQNQRLKLEMEAVVDRFRLEMAQQGNFRYLSLLRQLVRQLNDEREKHVMRTWRLDTMQLHSKFRVRDPITRVAVSDSGEFLFTSSTAKIHAWRMKKPSAPASAPLYSLCWGAKQSANVISLACTADAKRFFSGHDDCCIRSWQEDARGKGRKVKHSGKFTLLLVMRGHEGPVYDLLMYEGYLLSCGGDATVRFWRARSEETLQSTSLAGNMDLSNAIGMQVPGVSGTGCFCMSTFKPILDMNKFTEKDVVTQLLVGTSDGQVAAFVLHTDNSFLYTREWVVSATASVGSSGKASSGGDGADGQASSALATLGGVLGGGGGGVGAGVVSAGVSVTSVVCPNRFGDTWELCFAGTSAGEIKIFEFLWKDPLSGSKQEVRGFKPLWQHNVHAGPVSCLIPAGGWLFSGSHDMSVVAWREPTVHSQGVAQGHEDGYVAHQGRVTSICATSEMLYSVDDSGILLVRNSREKNEVKFIDGDGARQVSRLSDAAKARMVNDLKSAYTARKSFGFALAEFTNTSAGNDYADLLVPDVWLDTRNPEVSFQPPKFLESSLRDDALSPFTFLGQLCRHYFPKREIDREIPLEAKRWIETRKVMAKKAAHKSEANMATPTELLLAAQTKQSAKDKEEEEAAAMRADPTALVNSNKNATDDDGMPVVSVDLNGWVVQLPLIPEKTAQWLLDEACRAYHARKSEGLDANQLIPKDSMVEVPLDVPLAQLGTAIKPGSTLIAMFNGSAPKAYRIGTITLDLPFRKIGSENSDARRQWEALCKKDMAERLGGIKPSRIQILSLTPGSVVVKFKIYEEPGNPHAKTPTELFSDLQNMVEGGEAQIAGGELSPGSFADNTREVASSRAKDDDSGVFGFVGEWLTGLGALSGGAGEGGGDGSSDESSESSSDDSEDAYSDESDEDGDGFEDEPPASSGQGGDDAAADDDDTSSLALSVAERGRRHKARAKKQQQQQRGNKKTKEEEDGLMAWMGFGSSGGGDVGAGVGVSQSTVAAGMSYDDDGFEDEEEEEEEGEFGEDPMGYEGVHATEMVDVQAMDSRMESLSAWASAKQKEKALVSQSAVPKENMKQWVAAKAQGSGGGGGGAGASSQSQSLREWLLFDVALDHAAADEIEARLHEAGFETLAALTSSYAVITDRSLKEMGIRKMGHRAQLLTHLDRLRGKVGATMRPSAPPAASGGGGILSSMGGGGILGSGQQQQPEYGLATRLQQMEAEREREREERERQLQEIAELKDVVLNALQDPEKRAMVQGQHVPGGGGRVGKLLGVMNGSGGGASGGGAASMGSGSGTADYRDDSDDYDDEEDFEGSDYSGDSDAASSALGGSVGDAAEDVYAPQHMTPEQAARNGREVLAGRVFGVDLGKTQLRGRRDGIEMANATVKSYKHPYFTVVYDGSGEVEYLTLGEVQGLIERDARQMALDASAANRADDASTESEDSGDE